MTTTKPSKALNFALWTAQVILAGMFLMAGITKTTKPIDELATMLPWVNDMPAGLVRFIGVSEFLGALGLVLPSLLRIKPGLTPLAAFGLVLIMALAAIYHLTKGEFSAILINAVLGLIVFFIAWGRFRLVPVNPR